MDNTVSILEISKAPKETILWGTNESSRTGSQSASATITGYDLIKLWVGGNNGGSSFPIAYSKPVYLNASITGTFTVACIDVHGETGTVTVTSTTVSYSSSTGNYARINGIVGIKF